MNQIIIVPKPVIVGCGNTTTGKDILSANSKDNKGKEILPKAVTYFP
jgi:hypothetical protein